MSAKRMKYARAAARRYETGMNRDARLTMRIPWYIRPFRPWRRRWLERWEREHDAALRTATKRMAHLLRRL